jgi:hypothetical protein
MRQFNMSIQPVPAPAGPNVASDAQIEDAIRSHATIDRDWALCWAVLQLARAIDRSWGGK